MHVLLFLTTLGLMRTLQETISFLITVKQCLYAWYLIVGCSNVIKIMYSVLVLYFPSVYLYNKLLPKSKHIFYIFKIFSNRLTSVSKTQLSNIKVSLIKVLSWMLCACVWVWMSEGVKNSSPLVLENSWMPTFLLFLSWNGEGEEITMAFHHQLHLVSIINW